MSSLLPCTQCRRHLRVEDVRCPFCGAELAARAVPRWLVTAPKGAKRATLFALGVSLAAACETNDTPVYGATFAGGSGGQSGAGNGGTDTGGSDTGGSGGNGGLGGNGGGSAGDGGSGIVQPVYGAPVPPEPDAGPEPIDAGADATPPADAGDAGLDP